MRVSRFAVTVIALALAMAGCASGPSLRALNPDEAKIDVYPTGAVTIYGEPVKLEDINTVVKHSATEPKDTILIRLHGDPDSPEMLEMRKIVTDQMIRANHYKYRFFSTPMATVSTFDPVTKKTEIFASEVPVETLSGAKAVADVEQLVEEKKAFEKGTYVSEAATRQPIATEDERPEEISVKPVYVGGKKPKTAKGLQSSGTFTPPSVKQTSTTTKTTTGSSQEDLKKAWQRQQQQRRK